MFQINAILTVDSYKDEPLGIQHSDPSFRCTEAGDNNINLQPKPVNISYLIDMDNHIYR